MKLTKKEMVIIVCKAEAEKIAHEVEAKNGIIYFDRQARIEKAVKNLYRSTYALSMEFLLCHYKRLQAAGYITEGAKK